MLFMLGFRSMMYILRGFAALHAESLYVSGLGKSPQAYSLNSFQLAHTFTSPKKTLATKEEFSIVQLAIANHGEWLVVGSIDGYIRVHNTASAELAKTLLCEKGYRAQCVTVS